MNYNDAFQKLEKYGQTHLLRDFEALTAAEQNALLSQIENLDFDSVLYYDKPAFTDPNASFEPLPALTLDEIEKNYEKYEEAGLKAIREGKTGAVLLAGGQGTRLGSPHAKGMFDIGVTKPLFIFECLLNNLKKVCEKAGVSIPLYVMTSDLNHDETVAFFKEHDYFGYDPSYLTFFVQDMAPCTDFNGKVLLNAKDRIATSPNGNGGWFHSMKKKGLLEDLHRRGVEYLSAFGVDNVLQVINNPAFVGATVLSGCDVSTMVVPKANPHEKVGVVCRKNGRPSIVEYYEMTDEMIHARDEKGVLSYNYGVILNYIFKVSKLEEVTKTLLTPHLVKKAIPFIDENGVLQSPTEPNGYKYELLILDLVEMMSDCLPYEVIREKTFAPVKNKTGADSVETAREYLRLSGVEL